MQLPSYPLFETTVLAPDQRLLDELAAEFVAGADGEPEMERFLFGTLPVAVFDRAFASSSDPALEGSAELMWLLHLSGYFGGRWLRGEIAAAQPDAMLVGFSLPPTEEAFTATMEKAQVALDAALGPDQAALEYAAASLRQKPPLDEGGEEQSGLADMFGYNLGYMLEILASPPEGVAANPNYQIDHSGLFGCRYATPRLMILNSLAELQESIAGGDGHHIALVEQLLPIQAAAIPRGRGVWSGGLSVQGFSQSSYDQLLDVSSSFLETAQATALTMFVAEAEADAPRARIGALANAAMIVWLDAYLAGLTDGEGEIALPEFAAT